MTRENLKKALRQRIIELKQQAAWFREKDGRVAREYEVRALECERTLTLFEKDNKIPSTARWNW